MTELSKSVEMEKDLVGADHREGIADIILHSSLASDKREHARENTLRRIVLETATFGTSFPWSVERRWRCNLNELGFLAGDLRMGLFLSQL